MNTTFRRWHIVMCLFVASHVMPSPAVFAADADLEARLSALESLVHTMKSQLDQKDEQIAKLESQVAALRDASAATPGTRTAAAPQDDKALLDQMLADVGADTSTPSATDSNDRAIAQAGPLRLIDISGIINAAAGGSTASNAEIGELQGGGHDPNTTGFSFQQLELSIGGAVDPWFSGEAHIIFGEEEVELEEAFATTSFLPYGLELEAGYFLTEFGRINPNHLHGWHWLDQPIVNTRMFGSEGMRGPGVRLGWLTPLPWYSEFHLGMQQADGDFMASFNGSGFSHDHGDEGHGHDEEHEEEEEEEGEHHEEYETTLGGRPITDRETRSLEDFVYLGRWVNGWDLSDTWSMQIGVSGLFGPNNTGPDGYSFIYGGDLVVKWTPVDQHRGWPFFVWQTEIIGRQFHADEFVGEEHHEEEEEEEEEPFMLPSDTLADWGVYSQVLWGFKQNWAVGLRGEYASGSGDSYEHDEVIDRGEDPLRGDRTRISPMLMWQPSEYTRVRLQYNYDDAEFLEDGDAHSLWMGLEILFGSHPAHNY